MDTDLEFSASRRLPLSMALRMAGGREVTLRADGGGAGRFAFVGDGFSAEVVASAMDEGGFTLDYFFEHEHGRLDGVEAVVLLDADLSAAGFDRTFSNRRDIWLPTGLRAADGGPLPDGPAGDWDADNLLALFTPGGEALLVGAVMPAHNALELSFRDGRLRVLLPIETGYARGRKLTGEAVAICWDRPLVESLEWFGRLNRVAAPPGRRRGPVVAWNSWDWFGRHISQERMLEMVDLIRRHPLLSRHVEAIVLDDGWAESGDFSRPYAESFGDLAGMAEAITRAGFAAGIWYSPLRVSARSVWARENGDTILWGPDRGHYSVPLTPEAPHVALDYTHPKVLDKLRTELGALREMGFTYFKTDFLQMPNSNFRRPVLFNRHVTPVEGLHAAMQLIRSAIGDESYWLACGTETLPAAGLPDASRVDDDIRLRFATMQVCVRHCAAHFWGNGNLWLNDPDFLVVRGRDTAVSPLLTAGEELAGAPAETRPYRRATLGTGPVFDLEEARCWANFHIVYGGALALGDHPGRLNDRGLEMLAKVLEHSSPGFAGVPLDLAERNVPSCWLRPAREGWLLGLFNWDDEERTLAFARADLGRIEGVRTFRDIWTGRAAHWPAEGFRITLPPHTSRVFELRR